MTIHISLDEDAGWQYIAASGGDVWLKGYLFDGNRPLSPGQSANRLSRLPVTDAGLAGALKSFDGMYAAVIRRGDNVLAVADHIASIPLLIKQSNGSLHIANHCAALFPDGCVPLDEVDADAAIATAMSGYTVGDATLSRSTRRLGAGAFFLKTPLASRFGRYYTYAPWEPAGTTVKDWRTGLEGQLENVFGRMVDSLKGRTVVVPLSAGLDSRLIVSALRVFGHEDVRCFAYGLPGNFEARASEQIAERLGYLWTFVPYSRSQQRRLFAGGEHADYWRRTDTLAAVPFEQDQYATSVLVESGWIPRDSVIINGQSGDYITGNHIPAALGPDMPESAFQDWDKVIDAIVAKHFSLWGSLKSRERVESIRAMLMEQLRAANAPERPGTQAFGLYEFLEYGDRQSKYVVNGQRVYDFYGLDWRLPLWELPFVEFWRTVPLEHKFSQKLYRETLRGLDWGGVWSGIDDARRISPGWAVPVRAVARVTFAPFGRRVWHRAERQLLAYFMDLVCNYSHLPYWRVASDRRRFRNAISWFTERYLNFHGLDWTGAMKNK